MRFSNCSVLIPEGREAGSGHVRLRHGTVYTVGLRNYWFDRRLDATVEIDGKTVGCFRLNAGATLNLERGSEDAGRFTFFAADSPEGGLAGAGKVKPDDRGLVRVTFRPEKKVYVPTMFGLRGYEPEVKTGGCSSLDSAGPSYSCRSTEAVPQNCAPGVTGLTGHSGQTFYDVAALDYDPATEVVITLRLVASDEPAVRELVPVVRGNPTPAPVP